MFYITINNHRYNFTDDGIEETDVLTLNFDAEDHTFDEVKSDFESIHSISVYVEIEERVVSYFENITLSGIAFDLNKCLLKVTMEKVDETMRRLSDLEEAVNFLLVGGNE